MTKHRLAGLGLVACGLVTGLAGCSDADPATQVSGGGTAVSRSGESSARDTPALRLTAQEVADPSTVGECFLIDAYDELPPDGQKALGLPATFRAVEPVPVEAVQRAMQIGEAFFAEHDLPSLGDYAVYAYPSDGIPGSVTLHYTFDREIDLPPDLGVLPQTGEGVDPPVASTAEDFRRQLVPVKKGEGLESFRSARSAALLIDVEGTSSVLLVSTGAPELCRMAGRRVDN